MEIPPVTIKIPLRFFLASAVEFVHKTVGNQSPFQKE